MAQSLKEALQSCLYFAELDDDSFREWVKKIESWADEKLVLGEISREEAWDVYFLLLHECDCRWFWEDRERIVKKIDTKKYDPFKSKNAVVVFVARIRAMGMGLIKGILN